MRANLVWRRAAVLAATARRRTLPAATTEGRWSSCVATSPARRWPTTVAVQLGRASRADAEDPLVRRHHAPGAVDSAFANCAPNGRFAARFDPAVLRQLWVESTPTTFPLCPRAAGCLDERALRASPDRPLTSSRAGVIASMPTSSDRFRVPAKPRLPSEMLVHVRRGNSLGELSARSRRSPTDGVCLGLSDTCPSHTTDAHMPPS